MSGSTSSSPILIGSGEEEEEEECLHSTPRSPLKVIRSKCYRHIIELLDSSPEEESQKRDYEDEGARKKLKFSETFPAETEPIYEVPPPKYAADRILKILLDPNLPPSKICVTRPVNVAKSATYVVNVNKLQHPDDVKNDNFGSWKHSGSHPQFFRVNIDDDSFHIEKCAAGATGDDVVCLRRLHSVHPSNSDFKRMIAFVSGK